ncbi:hypothetical protein YC2023_054839 [Brassica napus]
MAGIDLLCIWKIDKSCEKIGAQVSQKLIVVHGIILLSLTAANTYDPQTLQMESEARGRSLVFSLYGGIYLFQSDSNDLEQSQSLSVRDVSSQPTQPTKSSFTHTARSIQTTCSGIR